MAEFVYVTECGCELTRDKLEYRKFSVDGRPTKRLMCIEHGGGVLHKKTICSVCGIDVIVPKTAGANSSLCPKHQAEKNREKNRIASRKYSKKQQQLKRASLLKYKMECGCLLDVNQIAIEPIPRIAVQKGVNKNKIYCPRCLEKGVVAYAKAVITKCIVCGDLIQNPVKGQRRKTCSEKCHKKATMEYNAKYHREKKALYYQRKKDASVNSYDCSKRGQCLSKSLKRNPHAEYLPCYQCKRYTPESIKLQISPENFDYFLPNTAGLLNLRSNRAA